MCIALSIQIFPFYPYHVLPIPSPSSDTYRAKGLHDVRFLPTCPVGEEAARVRAYQDANPATAATFGTVEQNVLIPALRADQALKVTAVAAMSRRSPLCVASLGPLADDAVVGAHADTVALKQAYRKQSLEFHLDKLRLRGARYQGDVITEEAAGARF